MDMSKRVNTVERIKVKPVPCTDADGNKGWKVGENGEEFYGFQAKLRARDECLRLSKIAKQELRNEQRLQAERAMRSKRIGQEAKVKGQ